VILDENRTCCVFDPI